MSIYMNRAFPSSNSSQVLCSGKAVQAEVLRVKEDRFVVDAGLGTPRICMQDEPTGVPINPEKRFENKVGYINRVRRESRLKKSILERLFRKVVAGESMIKKRAAAELNSLVGNRDRVAGEGRMLLPQRFRQKRAALELTRIWRRNTTLKGFFLEKGKKGYSVAIAGFITFLPYRALRKFLKIGGRCRFFIKSIGKKRMNIVVNIY